MEYLRNRKPFALSLDGSHDEFIPKSPNPTDFYDGTVTNVTGHSEAPNGQHVLPNKQKTKMQYLNAFRWWIDEYICLAICMLSIIALALLLWHYDGKENPKFAPGVQLDMLIIALVTTSRVAMGSIVEACVSQCAWIWVAKTHQQRTHTHAKLRDFKLFDEAARGLHLACIGALIIVVTHGFETFSQQMFELVKRPATYTNTTIRTAPNPPRSDHWDNIMQRGISLNYSLPLSTKAAIYGGMLASEIPNLEPVCYTGNCSWPIIPTLAVCGECSALDVVSSCSKEEANLCSYQVSDRLSLTIATDREMDSLRVIPLKTAFKGYNETERAYISLFELVAASSRPPRTNVSAATCALWMCIKSYDMYVIDGKLKQKALLNWSQVHLENETSAHIKEYAFTDIPSTLNVLDNSRYSVSDRSLRVIREFMDSLTDGTYEKSFEIVNFSSDWAEAIWNAVPNLEAWIQRLSLSLSNEVRKHGRVRDRYHAEYEGRATKMVDFIHVKWFWILYQPLFLLLTVYYLITTILAGARDDVAVWKNDSMPMLFTRIHPEIHSLGYRKMDTHKGLDDLGRHGVALTKNEEGMWTFEPTEGRIPPKRRFRGILEASGLQRW